MHRKRGGYLGPIPTVNKMIGFKSFTHFILFKTVFPLQLTFNTIFFSGQWLDSFLHPSETPEVLASGPLIHIAAYLRSKLQ